MLKNNILEQLASGEQKTTTEIAMALGIAPDRIDDVGRRLRELCQAGKVARLDMGRGKVAWKRAELHAQPPLNVISGEETQS